MSKEQPTPTVIVDPSSQVSGPSVGLLITGVIGGIWSLFSLISAGIGTSIASFWVDEIPDSLGGIFQGAFVMGSSLVGMLVAAFVIFAALKMKGLTQWGLAVAASILAMIPCISPCCVIGLPVGIWCLVILMRPEVKSAFH